MADKGDCPPKLHVGLGQSVEGLSWTETAASPRETKFSGNEPPTFAPLSSQDFLLTNHAADFPFLNISTLTCTNSILCTKSYVVTDQTYCKC